MSILSESTYRESTLTANPCGQANWTFLTNHGHVIACIARRPDARLRDVASEVGITERATQRIVADLVAAGYLARERVGRRNQYAVAQGLPRRHPVEGRCELALLQRLTDDSEPLDEGYPANL